MVYNSVLPKRLTLGSWTGFVMLAASLVLVWLLVPTASAVPADGSILPFPEPVNKSIANQTLAEKDRAGFHHPGSISSCQ